MKPAKIIFLTGSLNLGGTERNILHLATSLDPARFNVEVWSDYEGQPLQHALRQKGIFCASLKTRDSIGLPFLARLFRHNLPYQLRLFRLLRKNRDAVIHAFGFPMAYYAVILGSLAGCRRIVFAVQDWDVWKRSGIYSILDRIIARLAKRIIADGEGARKLAATRQGMPLEKIQTIYDGVDPAELSPARSRGEIRAELGLRTDAVVIGMIARLDIAKKAQDVFIRAIPEIKRRAPSAQFLIVGDGPDRQRVAELAGALSPEMRPIMAGFRTDLADIISALDILVIPSRWESVPKILLEAMWLERPVVATRVGDIAEILDDSCGRLIPPDSSDALAKAVAEFATDKELRTRLGVAAHTKLISQKKTLADSIREYEKFYMELLGQNA